MQFSGDSEDSLESQYIVYRGGFETKMKIPHQHPFVRVAGLDADGKLLGCTDLLETSSGNRTEIDTQLDINFTLDRQGLVR